MGNNGQGFERMHGSQHQEKFNLLSLELKTQANIAMEICEILHRGRAFWKA